MSKKHDSYESIRDERRYGPYWYSALWRIIRPILIGLGAVLVVAGILFSVWNKVYGEFIAPPDENSTAQVPFTIESGQSLTRVANRLEEAGLIRNRTVFKYYCDFAGWGQKILAVERFWDNTRWMIEFSVLRPSTAYGQMLYMVINCLS